MKDDTEMDSLKTNILVIGRKRVNRKLCMCRLDVYYGKYYC